MSIATRIALVTGSAQGIGRSIALRLARDGFNIALNDVPSKRDQLCAVAKDIEEIGRKTLLVPSDVTIDGNVKEMVQDTFKELGGLDVLVANAGIVRVAPLVSTELDEWEDVMAVNVRGAFLCYKYVAQQMIKQGRGGRIIGASSIVGRSSIPCAGAYASSKFAIRGLTQTAALELGRYNITVNAYAPGITETSMSDGILDGRGVYAKIDQETLDYWKGGMTAKALKHDCQPEDVASVVSYLASKEAHFITGQCITVDGGIVLS